MLKLHIDNRDVLFRMPESSSRRTKRALRLQAAEEASEQERAYTQLVWWWGTMHTFVHVVIPEPGAHLLGRQMSRPLSRPLSCPPQVCLDITSDIPDIPRAWRSPSGPADAVVASSTTAHASLSRVPAFSKKRHQRSNKRDAHAARIAKSRAEDEVMETAEIDETRRLLFDAYGFEDVI